MNCSKFLWQTKIFQCRIFIFKILNIAFPLLSSKYFKLTTLFSMLVLGILFILVYSFKYLAFIAHVNTYWIFTATKILIMSRHRIFLLAGKCMKKQKFFGKSRKKQILKFKKNFLLLFYIIFNIFKPKIDAISIKESYFKFDLIYIL